MQYSASYLRQTTPPATLAKNIDRLTKAERAALFFDWSFWAREKQTLPAQPFFIWLILAGRGFGKTRTGGETVRQWVKTNSLVNLIGATADDARDIMIEGESGILQICPNNERPVYKKSERKLIWPWSAKPDIHSRRAGAVTRKAKSKGVA